MNKIEIALLGRPEFRLDGVSITDHLPSKSQALLGWLAVTRQAHSREQVAGMLWGELSEESARRNLRVALAKQRHLLHDFLVIQRSSLAFNRESDYWLDTEQFEACVQPHQPTVTQLEEAVALYRGPFMAGLSLREAPGFEEWVRPVAERMRQLAMDALYRLSVHCTQQREYGRGIDYLSRLLALEPWLEEGHRQLMRLLVLSGQRSAALAQYRLCCAVLDEELGVAPAEATEALYRQIVAGEEVVGTEIVPVSADIVTWHPPFQPPPVSPCFVGRKALLAEIVAQISGRRGGIYALVGMGGVGKSALAAVVAHALQGRFSDGVLWANPSKGEPGGILESWAQLYGYDFTKVTSLEALATAVRGALTGRKILVVVDDACELARVRPLLPGGETAVLLTTRDQDVVHALNAQEWHLKPLPAESSRQLMVQILGAERVESEPEAVAEICDLLCHLPMAVEIVAQRLRSRPRRRLADMAVRLRDEKGRLSELMISDREVRASFRVSYAALNETLQRTFALAGLFGGRSFAPEALAAVADVDRYTVEERIFGLAALSLAQEEQGGRYSQHLLLADFAREMLGDGREEIGRLAAWYCELVRMNRHDYATLQPEWGNIMEMMRAAWQQRLWSLVADFAELLRDPWFDRARFSQAREGYAMAVEAALHLGERVRHTRFLHQWGWACVEQQAYACAQEKLQQSRAGFESLGDDAGLVATGMLLARVALEQGAFEEAEQFLASSRALCEKSADQQPMAELLHTTARLHFFRGEYSAVTEPGEQAVVLWERYEGWHGMMRTLNLLGSVALQQGLVDRAEQYGQRSLALSNRLNAKGERAMALDILGQVCRERREYLRARQIVEESLEIVKWSGDTGSQANALYQLGRICMELEDHQGALSCYEQSLHFCRIVNYRVLEAIVLKFTGDVLRLLGHLSKARDCWHLALTIARELNHSSMVSGMQDRLARA